MTIHDECYDMIRKQSHNMETNRETPSPVERGGGHGRLPLGGELSWLKRKLSLEHGLKFQPALGPPLKFVRSQIAGAHPRVF